MAYTPFEGEFAIALRELIGSELYEAFIAAKLQREHFARLSPSNWEDLNVPIGMRFAIVDLAHVVDQEPFDRRASLLGGSPATSSSSTSSSSSSSSSSPSESPDSALVPTPILRRPHLAGTAFTFKEALAAVPHFSGTPEEDVVSWLQEILTLVGDPATAAKVARSKLAGKPKEWLSSLKTPIPASQAGWDLLSTSLKSLYADPLRARSALEQLKTVRWQPPASITDHCISMVTWLERAEIHDDSARIDHLMNSVPLLILIV